MALTPEQRKEIETQIEEINRRLGISHTTEISDGEEPKGIGLPEAEELRKKRHRLQRKLIES